MEDSDNREIKIKYLWNFDHVKKNNLKIIVYIIYKCVQLNYRLYMKKLRNLRDSVFHSLAIKNWPPMNIQQSREWMVLCP